jgi:hypothetical protein
VPSLPAEQQPKAPHASGKGSVGYVIACITKRLDHLVVLRIRHDAGRQVRAADRVTAGDVIVVEMDSKDLDELSIDTICTLATDAVQQAHSGHPGTPMALAPVIYTLWQSFLRFDPDDPIWPNRDRFVLSVGHASMPVYAMLYLTGVKAVDADCEQLGEPSVTPRAQRQSHRPRHS